MEKRAGFVAKMKDLFSAVTFGLFKTTRIGKKLLTASRTNAFMKESYEELGRHIETCLENGQLNWDDPKTKSLLNTINACKKDLIHLEKQVNKIRFSGEKGLV